MFFVGSPHPFAGPGILKSVEALPDTLPRPRREKDAAPDLRAVFIVRHQADLWRYARFLGCPREQAEDYLQDAFLVALKRRVHTLPPAVAAQWLRTTVRNLFWCELRVTARRPDRVAIDLEQLDHAWVRRTDTWIDYLTALEQCLPRLDARDRRAIELRYRLGCSRDEMARELGMSPAGIKSLLQRIRRRLRHEVEARLKESDS